MPESDNDVVAVDRRYRAYLIGASGRIETATEIEASGDEEAILKAKLLVDGHDVELWERSRMVLRFQADAR